MSAFDIGAILITLAALFGYINHRLLKLPPSIGILSVTLLASLALLLINPLFPQWHLRSFADGFLHRIDFTRALLHGMLSFLLFAGALHVELESLRSNRWTVAALATVGVVLSTVIVGFLAHAVFLLLDLSVPLLACLVFGALISPTDPIAVIGLLKELRAPRDLEAKIAGESLFNDGVGVVIFFALLTAAGYTTGGNPHGALAPSRLAVFFTREVGGGAGLGLATGYIAYRALKSIDYHPLELLITLALVMATYSISFWIDVSGPIAVVVAGILIGNHGRRYAMSQNTVDHIDAFWSMVDEILNAVLFLLLGLELFALPMSPKILAAALLTVPIGLLSRLSSVGIPIGILRLKTNYLRGLVPILTWGGLRGGISVAMALSLPDIPEKGLLLASTYAIVLFSVLVQGLTMRRILARYGIRAAD